MSDERVTLRFGGGGSLSFADATGARHRVPRDEPFETDAATAAILLEDPSVTRADEWPDVPRGNTLSVVPEPTLDDLTVTELRERAAELGLDIPARARKADLVAAIDEAQVTAAAAQAADEGGASTPADDPDAQSSGEAGQPPEERVDEEGDPLPPVSTSTAGTISLGDLPPGARVASEQG